MVSTFYDIFAKVFGWVLIPLSLGLFYIVAAATAEVDKDRFWLAFSLSYTALSSVRAIWRCWVNTFHQVRLIDMTAEELLKFGEQEKLWL